jgi:ribonuclease BN (tRNA processing enzyme)
VAQSFLRSLLGRGARHAASASAHVGTFPVGKPLAVAPAEDWKLTVIGCGDAFGSGGRLQTSFLLDTARSRVLIDCGATTLMGFHRQQIDGNTIGTILISHLHGDHFSGLAWWLMHAHYVSDRKEPLVIAGPPGLEQRLHTAMEALFPGSSSMPLRFELTYVAFDSQLPLDVGGVAVTPFQVNHPSGAPAFAMRIESGGRCVAFSGDTKWVDNLVSCAQGANLFIVDCFGYDNDIGFHMSWKTISAHLKDITARHVLLTHMGPQMLSHVHEITDPRILAAEDGLVLAVTQDRVAAAGA